MRFGQAMVFVSDMPRMQAFYRDLLGLAAIEEDPGFARYDAGGVWFALHAQRPPSVVAVPPERRADCCLKFTFHVADLDAVRARLIAAGIAMDEPWSWNGHRACDGLDPEGNVFQIATPAPPPSP